MRLVKKYLTYAYKEHKCSMVRIYLDLTTAPCEILNNLLKFATSATKAQMKIKTIFIYSTGCLELRFFIRGFLTEPEYDEIHCMFDIMLIK